MIIRPSNDDGSNEVRIAQSTVTEDKQDKPATQNIAEAQNTPASI
jgi:hypothetical protein